MIGLGEHEAILCKVREISQDRGSFRKLDRIKRWYGKHLTRDWQEVLDELVEHGELTPKGDVYTKAIKEERKMTRDEAITRSIEMWVVLAERGCPKSELGFGEEYKNHCPLCEYARHDCSDCPLPFEGRSRCVWDIRIAYHEWGEEENRTTKKRKEIAKAFLEQLKQIPMEREEETVKEVKKVYKVLVETKEGKLVSMIAGGKKSGWDEYRELTYKEGEITYAPPSTMGIFVKEAIDRAIGHSFDHSGGKMELRVIHEAIPLGKKLPRTGDAFSTEARYPAILLGKEVWREKPAKLKEEWVDVTGECTVSLEHLHGGRACVLISHGVGWVMELGVGVGIERVPPCNDGVYKIEDCGVNCGDPQHTFRVWKKV